MIAGFFNDDLNYGSRKLDSYEISIEAPIFVRYVALRFNANFVVHTLGQGNDADPDDATQGLKRWSTHIYHPDGSAEAVNMGYSYFTVLNWGEFPYQIILYTTRTIVEKNKKVRRYMHYIPILSMTFTTLPVLPPNGEPGVIEKEVSRRVPRAPNEPTASTVPPTLTNKSHNGDLYGENKEASQDVVGSPPSVLLLPANGEPDAAVVGAPKEFTDTSVRQLYLSCLPMKNRMVLTKKFPKVLKGRWKNQQACPHVSSGKGKIVHADALDRRNDDHLGRYTVSSLFGPAHTVNSDC